MTFAKEFIIYRVIILIVGLSKSIVQRSREEFKFRHINRKIKP